MGAVTIDDSAPGAREAQKAHDAVLTALRTHTTLTLAYTDADGPQACAVLYAVLAAVPGGARHVVGSEGASQQGALVFVTAPTTRHGRALAAGDPEAPVAFTVQADGQQWTELTGVQGRGHVRLLPAGSPQRAAAWTAYTERFPFVTQDQRLGAALAATALWELRPSWLRLIDNTRGLGNRTEWPPSGASRAKG